MKTKISVPELTVYFIVWISANLYCLYKLYEAQNEVYHNDYSTLYSLGEIRPGWRFISRWQDVSDIEWSSCKFFFQIAWVHLLIQFIVSELLRNTFSSLLKYWYILSSVLFIVIHMGYKQLIIFSIQPIIFALLIFYGGKKASVWITSILILFSYNSLKYKQYLWSYLDRDDIQDEEVYLVLFTIAWIKLRCVSFCVDYIDATDKQYNKNHKTYLSMWETVVNMFSYVLYTPFLYLGPILLYEEFEKSFQSENEILAKRLKIFICDMIIYLSYTFLLDTAFHYIYFLAMQNDLEAIKKLPTLALCGGGLWMGLEFHLKYVISYGTTAAFARLDNLDPPPTPRCIARVHVYSQMWRHFDVGLYRFLVKYIYKPALQVIATKCNISRIINKLLASFLTFLFIFMWHGTIWNIFIWAVLNYIGILLEQLGKIIANSSRYEKFKKTVSMSVEMETRFTAVLCSPLLALSAISNFYLFAGSSVGNIYFDCFTHPSFFNSMLVCVSLYCCCHVSMALENVPSRTDKRNTQKCCYPFKKGIPEEKIE